MRHSQLVPPDKFGAIETGVYRSAFPTPESFGHLKLLALRTVVNLSQEALTRATTSFFLENHVLIVDVGLHVWTHPKCAPISDELIKEAMRYVLDMTHHPLLVMSASGTHQVGVLVGCLRRLQQWNLASALDEYRSYAAPSPRLFCEQFIELWDCDLFTLPDKLPAWFERQQLLLEEDTERWHRHRQQQLRHRQQRRSRSNSSESPSANRDEMPPPPPPPPQQQQQRCADEEIGEDAATPAGADEDEAAMQRALRENADAEEAEDLYFVVSGPLVPVGYVTSVVDTWDD